MIPGGCSKCQDSIFKKRFTEKSVYSKMTFSVIVPVYNVEKYIRQCLDSLVHQTFEDFEIIVVDDGSTDSSGVICDEYVQQYDFLHVIHQNNQGLSGARNRGLSEAKGEWLSFVDSDDWIKTDMLERLFSYVSSSQADLYRFNMQKTDVYGNPIEKLLFAVENESLFFDNENERFQFYFHDFLQYKTGWEVCGGIYRNDIVQQHQLRFADTKAVFAEDLLFSYQYLLYVKKMVQVCDVFYNYRQRETSLVNSVLDESILPRMCALGDLAYEAICREHMRYFKKNYYLLYFMLLNFHIKYNLSDMPDKKLFQMLEELDTRKRHCRFMRKIHRHKAELERYMAKRVWI